MPIELQPEAAAAPEPGQLAYEAISTVVADADELTVMGLLTAVQSGTPWDRLAPKLRRLLVQLEGELFEDDGGG